MDISVSNLVSKVKICIDEIALNDAEFVSGQDNTEMTTIIRSKIAEAVRYILNNADWGLLEPDTVIDSSISGSGITTDDELVGHVPLPDNYIRLCYAKYDSWKYYPNEVILWNDSEYAKLSDAYAGGTWQRPKVGLIIDTTGKNLELYKAKTSTDRCTVGIVTVPDIDDESSESTEITIPEKLLAPVIYYIAGLTLLTYKDSHADDMFNQALIQAGIKLNSTES